MYCSSICVTITLLSAVTLYQGVNAKKKRVNLERRESQKHTIIIRPQLVNGTNNDPKSQLLCQYYTRWSKWSRCNRRCEQSRVRRCSMPSYCGTSFLKEKRHCRRKRGKCSSLSYKVIGIRRNTLIEELLYDLLYNDWSRWGRCTRSCRKRRFRKCKDPRICGSSYIQQERKCKVPGTECEKRFSMKTFNSKEEVKKRNVSQVLRPSEKEGALSTSADLLKDMNEVCGIRSGKASRTIRIVGGRDALPHSWPWQVAILTRWQEQYCGGTMIAPGWILTAAHCIRKRGKRRRVIVRVGEHDLYKYSPNQLDMGVEKGFPHHHFDYETITNDIALLKLRRPETISKIVRYACLPDENFEVPDGSMCRIVGWGKEKNTHPLGSEVLKEAGVPIVSKRKCRKAFDYKITDKQICAGFKRGGFDSCAGDSGGPLLCPRIENGTTRWFVYGVTSYGEGCGQKGKFGIYTKVANYLKWIHRVIRNNT